MSARETPFSWDAGEVPLTGFRLAGTVPGGVFLHGFRSHCDGEKSRALARHAALRGRAWLRFNQRHSTHSEAQFAAFTLSQAVRDATRLLDWIGQPLILVGSSVGALIALEAARQRPAAVRGLLLLAPAVRFVERFFGTLPAAELRRWRSQGSLSFPDRYEGGEFQLDYAFYQDARNYINRGPWYFECPVAILHGDKDELLPAQDSADLRGNIAAPSVSLDIVPGGDHRLTDAIPLMCRHLDEFWQAA